jgi:hypothetical protein
MYSCGQYMQQAVQIQQAVQTQQAVRRLQAVCRLVLLLALRGWKVQQQGQQQQGLMGMQQQQKPVKQHLCRRVGCHRQYHVTVLVCPACCCSW